MVAGDLPQAPVPLLTLPHVREETGRMKGTTSIIRPHALLREIDRRRDGQRRSRSAFIEEAVRAFLTGADRAALHVREAALLRTHAAALNAEMADVLTYPFPS
jgi:Arc/MetJ-type ribon-helix-helix transcriptional regulator